MTEQVATLPTERIVELLERMNEMNDDSLHSITFFSDFSGSVQTHKGEVFSFSGPDDFEKKSMHFLRQTIGDDALSALKDLVGVIQNGRLMPDSLSYMKRALEVIAEADGKVA